jgi:protein O-GlcNAc transferase
MTSVVALLKRARVLAQRGDFPRFLATCDQLRRQCGVPEHTRDLLDTGTLLLQAGFLARASECFEHVLSLTPGDRAAAINRANVAREAGCHAEARARYDALLARFPDDPVLRRNALLSLEYDPAASDSERLEQARVWGQWATKRAGGPFARPAMRALTAHQATHGMDRAGACRPLRVGYVSADFCQHTVGLLIKDTLMAHDQTRVTPIAFYNGTLNDWVTKALRAHLEWRDVATLDDAALAEQIRQDEIDVLVDLSGHTAGSRLSVFAFRPAPVQVSWLGYFATTGLEAVDAVLLDGFHAPTGIEAQFTEQIIRLQGGRWCYQPVPFAPELAPLPADQKGYVTFGSFNNTAKYHPAVHALWARVLSAVPGSRLVLKWRTFNDDALAQAVLSEYAAQGITPDRIELRGPSFHTALLNEYADIDIALDPFPFSGGLTSCEALWMGVPVITLPDSRVVSRQTHAFVNQIDQPELSAKDRDEYVRIALQLVHDRQRLRRLRTELRDSMRASELMNTSAFTAGLEATLIELYQQQFAQQHP